MIIKYQYCKYLLTCFYVASIWLIKDSTHILFYLCKHYYDRNTLCNPHFAGYDIEAQEESFNGCSRSWPQWMTELECELWQSDFKCTVSISCAAAPKQHLFVLWTTSVVYSHWCNTNWAKQNWLASKVSMDSRKQGFSYKFHFQLGTWFL